MPEVTITLRTIDDSTNTNKKVKESFESLSPGIEKVGRSVADFVGKNATLIAGLAAGVAIVKSSYGEYAKLSESIRDLALVSGASAEESSRFIQVLDDYQLTAEDAVTASRFLKEKGLVPNIETLASLADQFKKIEDPAKRLEFVQENLGRGGAKWVNILSQESDALRDAAAAVNEHLVMTDKEIAQYEQQRLALDALSDEWMAAKVAVGQFFGEVVLNNQAMSRANEIYKENGGKLVANWQSTKKYQEALAQAKEEQEKQTQVMIANKDAATENEQAIEDLVKQQQELTKANQRELDTLMSLTDILDDYHKAEVDLQTEHANLLAEKQKLIDQGWWAESEAVQAVNAKLAENEAAQQENADEFARATNIRILKRAEELASIDGLTTEEKNALIERGIAMGVYTQEAAARMREEERAANELANALRNIPTQISTTITTYRSEVALMQGPGGAGTVRGPNRIPHADGGQFMIPMIYGNEGFQMGNGDTASGGETVTITPRGQNPNQGIDYRMFGKELKKAFKQALAEAG